MIGKTKLHINQATMIEAMQRYLNAEMTQPVKVTDVSSEGTGYSKGYEVEFEDGECSKVGNVTPLAA